MGHRALVAVEGTDGRYALYRSQWGGLAIDRESRRPASAVADAVLAGRRVGRDCTVSAVLDALDPRSDEALFVAGRGGAVESYRVVWLGLVLADGTLGSDSDAALVPAPDGAGAARLRAAVRTWKELLGTAVDAGVLSGADALVALRASVASHPDARGTLWLPLG